MQRKTFNIEVSYLGQYQKYVDISKLTIENVYINIQVFKEIDDQSESSVTVRISYLEIYNENMYDLLATYNEGSRTSGKNFTDILSCI